MADLDREVLFSNEAFVIGILQAVSGGSIVAALAQADTLIQYGGRLAFFFFVTATAGALALALVAAYFKHQYKMWDVKANASGQRSIASGLRTDGGTDEYHYRIEAENRSRKASNYLRAMRISIFLSLLFILLGIGGLIVAFWFKEFCSNAA